MSEGGMNMDVILIMCLGILVGRLFIPDCAKKSNERISLICSVPFDFFNGSDAGEKRTFSGRVIFIGLFQSVILYSANSFFNYHCFSSYEKANEKEIRE